MSTALKLRRGTTAQHSTFTGAEGEVTVDTTKDTVVVHDGSTAGGFPLLKENNPSYTGTLTGDTGVINIGSGQLYKDASGNVGIGTSSPAWDVQVQKTGNSFLALTAGASSTAGVLFGDTASNAIGRLEYSNGVDAMLVYTNGNERMRIDSSGNLLVGRTTSVGAWRLQAEGAGSSGSYSAFFGNTNTNTNGIYIGLGGNRSSDATNIQIACFDDVAARMIVRANGNVQNTNNSYGSLSDIKLKENIVDATPKLEKLNQVRVVNYNLIGEEQKQLGVIAQELEQIFPGMVDESPDRDADGNDLGTTTKSVKYSVFVPMLIKAIQEQQAIITALTARVEALEGAQP